MTDTKKQYKCSKCGKKGHNVRTCKAKRAGKKVKKKPSGAQIGNTNAIKHGYYSHRFKKDEKAALRLLEEHNDVASEIEMVRVMVDRMIGLTEGKDDSDEIIGIMSTILRGAGRIGHLVRVQKLLYGDSQTLADMLDDVLGEVARELGIV